MHLVMKKKTGPGQPAKTKSRLKQLEEEMTSSTTVTEEEDIINSKRNEKNQRPRQPLLRKIMIHLNKIQKR